MAFTKSLPRATYAHRAQAAIEFALVTPLMLLMVLGMIDLGRAFVFGVTAQEGSRQAARLVSSASYDTSVDDTAVLGRLIASADPALSGCTRSTGAQSCPTGTWNIQMNIVSTGGGSYSSVTTARAANALAGATATITVSGQVGLVPGFTIAPLGIAMPLIGIQGQTTMVIL